MKLLTICISSHNNASTIKQAIDSCMIKTEQLQIILVDNNSTDDTARIFKDYHDQYPNDIKVISSSYDVFNINDIMDDIEGLYFKILKPDDYLEQSTLVKVIETISDFIRVQNNMDMIITNYKEKTDNTKEKKYSYHKVLATDKVLGWHSIIGLPVYTCFNHQAIVVKTSIVKESFKHSPSLNSFPLEAIPFIIISRLKSMYFIDSYLYVCGTTYQEKELDYYYNITKLLLEDYDISSFKSRSQRKYMTRYLAAYFIITISKLTDIKDQARITELQDLAKQKPQLFKTMNTILFHQIRILSHRLPYDALASRYRKIAKRYRL